MSKMSRLVVSPKHSDLSEYFDDDPFDDDVNADVNFNADTNVDANFDAPIVQELCAHIKNVGQKSTCSKLAPQLPHYTFH